MATYGIGQRRRGSGVMMPGIAGETWRRGSAVYMSAVDGLWYLADSDALATLPVVGMAVDTIAAVGQRTDIIVIGLIGRRDWTWNRGDILYASGTPGVLTQVAPANAQPVAVAITATLIYVNPTLATLAAGAAGVTIRVNAGADVGTQPRLNLIEGDATYFTVGAVNDNPNTEVDITYTPLGVGVRERPAATQGPRNVINFVEGANVTITVADNAVNQEVDVTIAAAAAGGGDQDIFYEAPNPDDYKGYYASMLLTDGVSTTIRQTFYLPANYLDTWSVDVIVIPDATGNLRWGCDTNFGQVCTEEWDAHTDTIALGQTAVQIDDIECLDITAALTGAAASDLVGLTFVRDGGDALDTVNDEVHYIGVILRPPVQE